MSARASTLVVSQEDPLPWNSAGENTKLRNSDDPLQASREWAKIGQIEQRRKNYSEARAAYQQAIQLDSSNHGCLANLAQLEAHAGNTSIARELLTRAIKLDPNNSSYRQFSTWLR